MSKQKSGSYIDGKWESNYDIGYNAYHARRPYSNAMGNTWRQGWRAARDNDMKLLQGAQTRARKDAIIQRMCEAMGITEFKELAA